MSYRYFLRFSKSYLKRSRFHDLLILTLFTVFASGTGLAFEEVTHDAPVMPGTKIVEGDKDQNEFYVIAADDTETLREVLRKTELKKMNDRRRTEPTKIELALNDALEHAVSNHHNFKPRLHYAAQQKNRKHGKKMLAYNTKADVNIES